jgi:hypothetical protein
MTLKLVSAPARNIVELRIENTPSNIEQISGATREGTPIAGAIKVTEDSKVLCVLNKHHAAGDARAAAPFHTFSNRR